MQINQYNKGNNFAPEATFNMHHTYGGPITYNQQMACPPQYSGYQNSNMSIISSSEYPIPNQNYYVPQNQSKLILYNNK